MPAANLLAQDFVAITAACVAGVVMVPSGFVLKPLLDNVDDVTAERIA